MRGSRYLGFGALMLGLVGVWAAGPAAQVEVEVRQALESRLESGSREVKSAPALSQEFRQLLQRYPPSLPQVLRLDPTLLTNKAYLEPYPELAAFLARHPEIARNPDYFLSFTRSLYEVAAATQLSSAELARRDVNRMIESFSVGLVFAGLAVAFLWLVRQLLNHRRWLRATKVHTEMQARLLDRMQSADEIRAYLQSPDAARVLASLPLTLDEPRQGPSASRVLVAMQAGVVLSSTGIGVLIAKRVVGASGPGADVLVFAGIIVLALGVGFALAAATSYTVSRRLGLLPVAKASQPETM